MSKPIMVEVYHVPANLFGYIGYPDNSFDLIREHIHSFEKVAEVEVFAGELMAHLETAYMATNSIEESWTKNENVTVCANHDRLRSTSVGDVVVHMDICYMVDPVGFKMIDSKENLFFIKDEPLFKDDNNSTQKGVSNGL